MQIPLREFLCGQILGHPVLRVLPLNPDKIADKNDFTVACSCEVCGHYFLTDKKGLKALLRDHDIQPKYPQLPE